MFVLTKVMSCLFLLLLAINVCLAGQLNKNDWLKNFTIDLDKKYVEKEMIDYQDEEQFTDYREEEIETRNIDYYWQSFLKVVDFYSREVPKQMVETKTIKSKKKAKEYIEVINNTLTNSTFTENAINIYVKSIMEVIHSYFGYFFRGPAPKLKKPKSLKSPISKLVGDSVRLRCFPKSQTKQKILWYQNYTTRINTKDGWKTDRKWSLIKLKLTKEDTANYTCIICNNFACINHTTELKVQDRFLKKSFLGNFTVQTDDQIRFTCPFNFDKKSNVIWIKASNENIRKIAEIALKYDSIQSYLKNSDAPAGELVINNVTKKDQGWYVCVIFNNLGEAKAKGVGYLTVIERNEQFSSETVLKTKTSDETATLVYTLSSTLAFLIVVFLMAILIFNKKLKQEKMKREFDVEKHKAVKHYNKVVKVVKSSIADGEITMPVIKLEKQKLHQVQANTVDMTMMIQYKLPLELNWEVPRNTVSLVRELGEGEFGKVLKAYCCGILGSGLRSVVAVKMLKDDHTEADLLALVSEMEMLKIIGQHMNIINLLGCCTQDGPLYVIMEYAANGSLKDFLRRHRTANSKELYIENKILTMKDLVSYSYQVAKGMEYITNKKCIHRDLAARNVLVSENYVMKIADFGLAKDVHSHSYYRKKTEGKLPVRWMAPEALLDKCFSIKSDIWSFGVLLWEIMTLGGTPYPTVPGQYMYQHLSAGHRMEKPPLCSDEIYNIMSECWIFEPEGRPTFTQLVNDLDRTLTKLAAQEYLDLEVHLSVTPSPSQCGSGDESGDRN